MHVRSITLHIMWNDDFSLVDKFLEVAETASPLTVRVSVAPTPPSKAEGVVKLLKDRGVKYISAIHIYYNAEEVYHYVSQYNIFATISDVVEYVKFLKILYTRGEVHLSRYVSLVLGGAVYNSPYFPASITTKKGISISLLYPNDLNNIDDVERALKKGEEIGRHIASIIGVEFLGVDGSLSPWGEESVAKAVERLFGVRLGEPGSHYAIRKLNNAIEEARVKKVGFNEVMLPLAEDEELKRLVKNGALNLDKFISYTSVCIPGLDMAPIRIKDWELLKRALYDLAAIAETKGRPIGVRIFPVDAEEYYIEGFGPTPALLL
ncbi:DUF711 family protein [Pyrobaculum aerophilum]|uniref:DUF711 family protein n=2 Tax=Pyrobaculum aerophilum TaxID=13773 RepID=Q8ZVS2_PYRAE|nr:MULTISPECIES: DUF711 family protein [Pyrobaculum]AAL63984.1 conserved hypothetical protein [Pyrobaculum aerophilum str. IM2]MCX8136422.1 DUF711 family protein [Pyrobaculum aerophilum]HII47247.1 DUF711 family protein [Pyrobaculum aerophilum]